MFVNLTPHPVTFKGAVIPRSGFTLRLVENVERIDDDFVRIAYGDPVVVGPDGQEMPWSAFARGTDDYIVSSLVLDAVRDPRMCAPALLVRDDKGNIVGCNAMRRA